MRQYAQGHRFHVLVVDDDQAIRKLVRHNLECEDMRVVEAANGIDCLNTLRKVQVDLILLDLGLPDFNGWGIVSVLRLTESLSHIPVMVLTAESPNRALMEQFKPDGYIQKPFDIRGLLEEIKRVICLRGTTQ